PRAKQARFVEQYGLPRYDAEVLTTSPALADFFEACVAEYGQAKPVSNWIMGEFLRLLKAENKAVEEVQVSPKALADLLRLVDQGVINANVGKEVFEEMFRTGKEPGAIVKERGLEQISDAGALAAVVDQVIAANADVAERIRGGELKAMGFLVGQVMKQTGGKANPKLVQELLRERLLGG
ncbi:MAG TPA: Asp-tRNA(Asn)/Glu-tRNA(Gln) amidotransferase GatCAB subunit B, partial [Limnochordales bacterium]